MLRHYSFLLFCLSLTTGISHAASNTFPQAMPVPGGIVIVKIGPANKTAPIVHYHKNRVMILEKDNLWFAIVGIPLSAKPGKHYLQIANQKGKPSIRFEVLAKNYDEQHITIKNKRKVNPNAEDMKRINNERKRINAALKTWVPQTTVGTEFVLPVEGRLSSPFGLRRFFNQQARKPHSGIDIAATEGTLIISPAAGEIIETGDFFFNGNSVFIDHGQGLVTLYCHLSNINVTPGQRIAQGEVIGAIGQTGRVTGPHLHWSVSLNNARVDPGLFFKDLPKLLNISEATARTE